MNRHVKMSAILIVLVLALSMVFVSCDELENAVIELETKIDETFQTSIDTAKTDLETAKGELKALIESGDAVSAQALTAAIEALNAAIDEAEKAAADANAADKAALENQMSHFLDFWLERDSMILSWKKSINKNLINAF